MEIGEIRCENLKSLLENIESVTAKPGGAGGGRKPVSHGKCTIL